MLKSNQPTTNSKVINFFVHCSLENFDGQMQYIRLNGYIYLMIRLFMLQLIYHNNRRVNKENDGHNPQCLLAPNKK